jgi:hypothetical protein
VAIHVTPADAEIWVDGTNRGRGSQTLSLTVVPHQIEVRKSGLLSSSSTVTPRPGLEQAVEVTLMSEAQQRAARTPATMRAHGAIELRLIPIGRYTGAYRRGWLAPMKASDPWSCEGFYGAEISNAIPWSFAEHKSVCPAAFAHPTTNRRQVSWQDAAPINWLQQMAAAVY